MSRVFIFPSTIPLKDVFEDLVLMLSDGIKG